MHSVHIEIVALRFIAQALPAVTGYPTSYIATLLWVIIMLLCPSDTNHSVSCMHFLFAYVTLVEVILMS